MKKFKKLIGANKNVVKNIIHKDYVDVFFNKNLKRHKMKRIQSKLCEIKAYDIFNIYLFIYLFILP